MDKLVLGAATLALSAGAASAQTFEPAYSYGPYGLGYAAPAPLYDYAGPAEATPKGYGPLIYAPQLYAPSRAFPEPPTEPGYYTVQSVVVSRPLYDYAPGAELSWQWHRTAPRLPAKHRLVVARPLTPQRHAPRHIFQLELLAITEHGTTEST